MAMIANEHIKIGSNFYEKVKTFKYLGSLLKNQNYIQQEKKNRIKAGNSCCYSVQHSCLLYVSLRIRKMKIYETIILPIVLNDCETWSLTLKEECRLRVFKYRNLRRIFRPKRDENEEWRYYWRVTINGTLNLPVS